MSVDGELSVLGLWRVYNPMCFQCDGILGIVGGVEEEFSADGRKKFDYVPEKGVNYWTYGTSKRIVSGVETSLAAGAV